MKRILIIEDDISIAELERDYLKLNGYQVDIESKGDTGLKKALSIKYDLIILDLMLPNINGFEICQKIREKHNIPILMVSAKQEDIDKIRGFGMGADDYITKPFSPSELIARVKAHISRFERLINDKKNYNDIIEIRNLSINKSTRRILVNGVEVNFTSKEFDLLVFLASNPDIVFSKEQLFDNIWGVEAIGDMATITVHIGKLREKIELNPSEPQIIETVWGAGYRFRI